MEQVKQVAAIKTWLGTGSINIFGPQLSGKDTQGQRLAELLDGVLIGGGNIIRHSERTDIKAVINHGELAPTDEFLQLVLPYFSKPEFTTKPLILSAIGRWHGEETAVIEAAEASHHPLKAVIFIELSEDEIWKRWRTIAEQGDRSGRDDDTEAGLRTRLQEYQTKTLPVLDYYRQQGLLITVDGNQPRDKVMELILEALSAQAQH